MSANGWCCSGLFHGGECLPAIGWLGAVGKGKIVHGLVNKIGVEMDTLVGNCLIAMYCRVGNLSDACRIFDADAARDLVAWNA